MEPEPDALGKNEPREAGDRGQGRRGGWVRGELDKTKPAQREQVDPVVLPPCEETPPCPAESFTIYTVYFIIIEPAH